jgi:hypothetical protein
VEAVGSVNALVSVYQITLRHIGKVSIYSVDHSWLGIYLLLGIYLFIYLFDDLYQLFEFIASNGV